MLQILLQSQGGWQEFDGVAERGSANGSIKTATGCRAPSHGQDQLDRTGPALDCPGTEGWHAAVRSSVCPDVASPPQALAQARPELEGQQRLVADLKAQLQASQAVC